MTGTVDHERQFAAVYEQWCPSIRAYFARWIHPERIDDAVAETFLVAWRRIDDVPNAREGLLWLYRVASFVLSHEWRTAQRRARLATRLTSVRAPVAHGPEARAVQDDECRRVLDALEHLDPSDAELLKLVAWDGLSSADIAVVLDLPVNTASQRVRRARNKLAQEFDHVDEAAAWRRPARQGDGS